MRLFHCTDIHWFVPPTLGEITVKRLLGTANLYLGGRRRDYDRAVQAELVRHALALAPDAVFVTGDLTAQGLEAEFAVAREALDPLLREIPSLVIPGNHDHYTPDCEGRFARHFGPWAGGGGPLARLDVEGEVPLTLLGLDTNRPTWITANGNVPPAQRAALSAALAEPSLAGRAVVLGLHHPPVDRHGAPYVKWSHGLTDAVELAELLDAAPHHPHLVLCGHVHHGFRATLSLPRGVGIPVVDCGTSGHTHQPERGRAAACAVYDLGPEGLRGIERWLHDGQRFVPEPGGAFASHG